MGKKYQHKLVEASLYQEWINKNLFSTDYNSTKPKFCIVLPPPNITGQLHLGHAWDGTIQDVLIRYHKLLGYETLFIPGTDHAGIATQVKVMEQIKRDKNIPYFEITKDLFFEYAQKWKTQYQTIIHKQWAKLGLALNYDSEKFTMEPKIASAVNEVFVQLYKKGLIYQGTKIVNWDSLLQTAISNIEVNYKEVKGKLYFLKYFLPNNSDYIPVATTRPETMFADQAIIVNADDSRYQRFIGKFVINPANNQLIQVITDSYVDIEFGSGAMKCTPAHDFNDYEIGLKYNLAMPICMNKNGTMNELAGKYQNLDRFTCRAQLIEDLRISKKVEKITDHLQQIGFSQRTQTIVEPCLSKQWFIKMKPVAELILMNQNNINKKIDFFPKIFAEQLEKWLTNINDWCISRQLWWGNQIPVWYNKKTNKILVSALPPENLADYIQETDVLDTWFSSALWPLLTLDWPDTNSAKYQNFFPTNVLVTAYDILFFWVVRMIFMGLELVNNKPFQHVLIHGLIRDENGKKMSKSLNNGVNPIDVIEEYGADALRYFLISNCAPGQDLRFSTTKIASSWNLINKLWNAARFVLTAIDIDSNTEKLDILSDKLSEVDYWILNKLNKVLTKVSKNMENYEFVIISNDLAKFIWNQYCSWYIELSKYNLQNNNLKLVTAKTLRYVLEKIVIILHPFIPFVTDKIFSLLGNKKNILEHTISQNSNWSVNTNHQNFIDNLINLIISIREIRKELNLSFKTKLFAHLNTKNSEFYNKLEKFNQYLLHMVNCELTTISENSLESTKKIIKILNNAVLEVETDNYFDEETSFLKLKIELKKVENEIDRSTKILNNHNFVQKASASKVKMEQDKLTKYENQKTLIINKIKEIKNK